MLTTNGQRSRIGLYVFLAILAVFLAINVVLIRPYLLAILMGLMLTVLARQPYSFLREKGMGPKVAAGIVVTGILFLLIGPATAFLTIAVKQALAFGEVLSEKDIFSMDFLLNSISRLGIGDDVFGGGDALEKQIRSGIQGFSKFLSTALLGVAGRFPEVVLQVFLAHITCFFLLLDGKHFLGWLADKVPLEPEVKSAMAASFQDTTISVVWSTMAAAATQSMMMFLAFWALRVPGAFLAAGATFIFAWIPIVGSTPVWLAGAIYLYTQGAFLKMSLMIGAGLLTSVADNFVRPLVLKGRGNMHPLVSLVAIFGGIEIFGILGVFLGPVLAGILTALLQIWPIVGRRFGILP